MLKAKRKKKCKAPGCGKMFSPFQTTQKVCGPECADRLARATPAKEKEKGMRHLKKVKLEQMKTKPQLTKEAQKEFNAYIRERDMGRPCISCGRSDAEVLITDGWKPGGAWDCGHFLSVGSHPELRFDTTNAHRQCKSCNAGSAKYAGKGRQVSEAYEENLVEVIGFEAVEWLKGPHEMPNWTHDELREIRDRFRGMKNELRRKRREGIQ